MRVTTNPSIFEKAITERTEYDGAIERCVRRRDEPAASIYDAERAASGDRMKDDEARAMQPDTRHSAREPSSVAGVGAAGTPESRHPRP
jgi:transaldolase